MLNIGSKVYRNLPEQVAENIKQIAKIWEKLDGLDVYDNVIIIENLDPLTSDKLEILAKPVSFIVYNNELYMKRGVSGTDVLFDKVYQVSVSAGVITFAYGEIIVSYPLGTLSTNSGSTTTYTKDQLDTLLNAKVNKTDYFPIGAIYMSTNNTSPASFVGGTWQRIEDVFLLAAGNNYNAGDTGGAATVTLTTLEMPSHRHYERGNNASYIYDKVYKLEGGTGSSKGAYAEDTYITTGTGEVTTEAEGSGGAHNNMPPYLVVYVWKRTA